MAYFYVMMNKLPEQQQIVTQFDIALFKAHNL